MTFVPMASSGGVEAMPAISPFTGASDLEFEQRAAQVRHLPLALHRFAHMLCHMLISDDMQAQDITSASGVVTVQPKAEEEAKPLELSTQDLLVDNPLTTATPSVGPSAAALWGMGAVRRSSEWRVDVLGSQPSWMLPQQLDQEVH